MTPHFFYSLPSLVRAIEREAPRVSGVSFDVFDTLLVRRIHDPDLLKESVARYIIRRAAEAGITLTMTRVMCARNDIEARHRRRNGALHPDHEARYPDFMNEALRDLFGDRMPSNLLRDVTQFEMDVESSMLVARKPWRALLASLREQGKSVIALTDIYLPSGLVRQLLDRAGIGSLIDDVRSSADSFRAKASGAGFADVVERHGWQTSSWLHVGDNPFSDGLRPSSMGIRSFVLLDGSEKKRKAVCRRYWNAAKTHAYWRGRAQQQLMAPMEGEIAARDELYRTGYEFMGPLLCGFLQHVAERCRDLGIRRIYFLAREGQLFMRIWDRLAPRLHPRGGAPSAHYLHVSRLALGPTACAASGITEEMAQIAFLPPGNRDLRDLCRVYGLSTDDVLPFARRHHLYLDTPLSPNHAGWTPIATLCLQELLADHEFQAAARAANAGAAEALRLYLQDECFFAQDSVGVVDIGWLGTIQRFLASSLSGRAGRPRLHGFLFAATRGVHYPATADNDIEGWFYDANRMNLAASTVMYCLEMFEECCRADHPGLMAYEKSPDGYRLRHRASDDPAYIAEKDQAEFYRPLQQGILDAASRFGEAARVTGFNSGEIRLWLSQMAVARMAFPRTREVTALRFRYHLNDFDSGHKPMAALSRRIGRRLWNEPAWRLRIPGLRAWYAARHALTLMAKS